MIASEQKKYAIKASFDSNLIAVYAAFSSPIADIAIKNQKLLPPFSYSRMSWIKPSYLWLMYRSNWGQETGMTRILKIWIHRSDWDGALNEAVLTTPEPHVYADARKWRTLLDGARVRIQWDPERNIRNERLPYKSIQVGITPSLSEMFAKKWIAKIEDYSALTSRIRTLVFKNKLAEAELLLPIEEQYPLNQNIAKKIGMEAG